MAVLRRQGGGATALSTLALASGVATFTTSSLAASAHSITCSYSGRAQGNRRNKTGLERVLGS